MQCKICFQNIGGKTSAKLTNHIRKEHKLSFEDYIIKFQYNNVAPLCSCGLCDLRPAFYRGKFSKYALHHDEFDMIEKLYIKKYNLPRCLHCNTEVKFYRGIPRQYCSHTCAGSHNGGFTKQETQNKIINIVIKKYGVNNISKLSNVKEIISMKQVGINNSFFGQKHTHETLKKISEISKNAWKNNIDRRFKFSVIMSKIRKRNWQNPIYRKTILQNNLNSKHSKLHQKIASYLGLKELGFESEKVIFRYRVDEINYDKKIIIEINGDYIHANPSQFKDNDVIIVRKSQYLAKDKWIYDQKRKEALEALGFKVFIIWQSDDLDKKKLELYQLLGI